MSASERLSTLDAEGWRQRIIPAEVRGYYQRWRSRVNFILLIIFLGLPWLKIGGHPVLWLDIPHRRFEIFGTLYLAHDAPKLFLLVLGSALALFLATALWGRVWCGWACPQTVFIDAVYRKIEIWIEGKYIERRKLYAQPMDFRKFRLMATKWVAYLAVSSLFAHSFIAYFAGADNLLEMMQRQPAENWGYFLLVTSVTLLTAFNFGFFREHFCLIMCPYGRFQSVLMDSKSVTVTYDATRGEPRKKGGDCVACNRCVQVCPTNIDIRDGVQMECIACTACIDACDEIMRKVKKPEGLIRYASLQGGGVNFKRVRVVAYAALMSACIAGWFYTWAEHDPFKVSVLRATDAPFQILPDGQVLNHFKVHVLNQSHEAQTYQLTLVEDRGAVLTQAVPLPKLEPGHSAEAHIFLRFPIKDLDARGQAQFAMTVREESAEAQSQRLILNAAGPFQPTGP